MRNKTLLIISPPIILIAVLGLFYRVNSSRPSIETKFVQEVTPSAETADFNREPKAETSENENKVIVKKAGNSGLVELPYHTYQTFNNCGPATLSMILSFYGKKVSQKELADLMRPYQIKSGDNDDKTIFTYEFTDWAKQIGGVEALSRVDGNINLLKTFTANGIPVVVKTWLHPNEDIGHFRIVKGFDENKKVIIQDDSYEGPNKKIQYFDFLSMWQPFNYAYIIVYTADKKDLVESILGAELDDKTAWQNALAKAQEEEKLDPASIYPKFNQVTSLTHLGDYQKSVNIFETIEDKLPRRMLWYQIEPVQAYFELGNYQRVFEISDRILAGGNRAFSELYLIRGDIYKKQGKTADARSEYEKAVLYNSNLESAKEALNSL